jgi:Tfp pilus assembly protein PilX
MRKLGNEQGSALMMAIMVLFIILGLGTALMATANGQKTSAANEQNTENSFSMAEAALNAQIYQLSVTWPTAGNAPSGSTANYPKSCTPSNAGTSYCPTLSDLSAYPTNTQTCPAGTPGDAWNPGGQRSTWTTYVRDAGASGSTTQQYFQDATEENTTLSPPYNSSYQYGANNYVWVRAVGQVNCKTSVVIAEVSMQSLGLSFPKFVLNANGFSTCCGQSPKTIINTLGEGSTPSQISVRCGGTSYTPPPPQSCASYGNSSQISPTNPTSASSWANPPSPSPVLTASQLAQAKAMAQANGTYYPASTNCNNIGASQLTGALVYIEGGPTCNISVTGSPTINSSSSPGWVILNDGTLSFGGGATFYGVIYGVNASNQNTNIVTLGGTSTVIGGLAVNGNASLSLGSSGNGVDCTSGNKCGDIEFDPNAFNTLVGFGGAQQTPNTFRQLPASQ